MLTANNIEKFNKGVELFARYVFIWPPTKQIDGIGAKHNLVVNLDTVAKRMRTIRPHTEILKPREALPSSIVLKRSHSDTGEHVIMPGDANRNWDYLESQLNIPGSVWLGQTEVPTLRKLGEWRVMFIGGQIIFVVHTRRRKSNKSQWYHELVSRYCTLSEIRYVIFIGQT